MRKYAWIERMIVLYLVIGLIFVGGLSLISVFWIHFALAVFLGAAYIGGLIYLIIRGKRVLNHNLMRIHFNLALALKNENDTLLHRYGLRARPGYLSRWVEYHNTWDTTPGLKKKSGADPVDEML